MLGLGYNRDTDWTRRCRRHRSGESEVLHDVSIVRLTSCGPAHCRDGGARSESDGCAGNVAVPNMDTLNYELTADDPETYTEPWTVAFPYKRDNDYQQFEYACHEGNFAVPNSLSGARAVEAAQGQP